MKSKILIIDLPKSHGPILGCRYNGYVVHVGHKNSSLNHATVYSKIHNIVPDQQRLRHDFNAFKKTLETVGFDLVVLPFPDSLNQIDSLHHDAVFIRDSGFMYKDYWIKGKFSVNVRQKESDVYAPIMAKTFNKKIVELPPDAYLEFGETIYIETKNGSFYFGGLSRSNKIGHDFVKNIINPDHYVLIHSAGYHLDTVFSPVINKDNTLVALLITKGMLTPGSIKSLTSLNIEIILLDNIDSSGHGHELGNYAVNALTAPGVIISSALFTTRGVEEKLASLGVKHYVVPLTDYKYAGGSVHCLTNEIYE